MRKRKNSADLIEDTMRANSSQLKKFPVLIDRLEKYLQGEYLTTLNEDGTHDTKRANRIIKAICKNAKTLVPSIKR